MARVEPLSEVRSSGPSASVMMETWGFVPNSMMTFEYLPGLPEALDELVRVIMLNPGKVQQETKWLVAHITSRAAGCRYCSAHTLHFGQVKGALAKEKLERAWEFESSELFDPAERAAMRLALAAGLTPNEATDEHFKELHNYFSDAEIVELVSVIALFGFMNRWNDTMGTDLEDLPSQDLKSSS